MHFKVTPNHLIHELWYSYKFVGSLPLQTTKINHPINTQIFDGVSSRMFYITHNCILNLIISFKGKIQKTMRFYFSNNQALQNQ